jgi:hypothetical protein
MKKISALLFAVVSTLFLTVGAVRAAGHFDTLANPSKVSAFSNGLVEDPPAPPCSGGGGEEENPK